MPDHASPPNLAINWQVGTTFGWGIYGLQIALHLMLGRRAAPVLIEPPAPHDTRLIETYLLRGVLDRQAVLEQQIDAMAARQPLPIPMKLPMLHAFGNRATPMSSRARVRGNDDSALIFSEDTRFSAEELARLAAFPRVVAGSGWNAALLRGLGLTNVTMNIQGVDPALYHPAPRSGLFRDRFVVFSGGKLEFRKGQDIVLAAFRAFRQRHPEALLLAAWHNHWPYSDGVVQLAASHHGTGSPRFGEVCDARQWCARTLPEGSFLTVADLPPPYLARLMREADAAVFANRCEGGTNLVAMEAMACGLPTVLSANTGHLDLIAADRCVALSRQGAVTSPGCDGWGESDVEEIVAALELLYQDRAAGRRLGAAGAAFILGEHSWEASVNRLADIVGLPR